MNYIRRLSTLALLCSLGNVSFSQHHFSCGATNRNQQIYDEFPALEQEHKELLERSKHTIVNSHGDREDVYIIPVVFHILHQNGDENISDAQVFDQMEVLNRDYRKLNADTSEIMAEFKAIAADAKIEFRLANKDPFGECSNGIEHIYSHETVVGDDFSKLNQWPRSRYLNIWIVKTMKDGVAGYAYYPSAVSTGLYFADGIIIRHNYIGRIGTSNENSSRALTHEIGHWLGLPHTWGNTNSPGVKCGDDGIEDTPETAGYTTCVLVDTDKCNSGIAENVQNYMEYSYCSRMFTEGQSAVMTTSLGSPISGRNNLPTSLNLISTGTDVTPTVCTPLPDFYSDKQVICVGKSIQFNASVSRATVETYAWSFPGGEPAVSSDPNPVVTYNTHGYFPVELKVTNEAGSETKVKETHVYAFADFWEHEGTYAENFENDNFNTQGWVVLNPQNDDVKWELIEGAGFSGNKSVGLKYYKSSPDPLLLPFYYERLGGAADAVVSPAFNLTHMSSSVLNFKYSFATTNSGVYDPKGVALKVYYMKACEGTWNVLKIIKDENVICQGFYNTNYLPNASSGWENVSISLPVGTKVSNVKFKFEFTANDFANNFFIDDINISGVVGIDEEVEGIQNLSVYPNPTQTSGGFYVNYYSADNYDTQVLIVDMLGKVIYTEQLNPIVGMNEQYVDFSKFTVKPAAGIYTVVLQKGGATKSERLAIK